MIVSDASTLILLAKADLLNAVLERFPISITDIVARECTVKQELYDAKIIKNFIEQRRITVENIKMKAEERMLARAFRMGSGEASSVLLAKATGSPLATDDGQALKACKLLGIAHLTAIHFLLDLNRTGEVARELALAKLKVLEQIGRYDPEIIRDAIKRIT